MGLLAALKSLTSAVATSVATAVAATALSATPGVAPTATPAAGVSCGWRLSAVRLYQELAPETSPRAMVLRTLLDAFGVGKSTFLPQQCRDGSLNNGGSIGGTAPTPSSPGSSAGQGATAAATLGWGTPDRVSGWSTGDGLSDWNLYDGPGHAGNGRRSPSAVSVLGGLLTITGDSAGTSEGMAWMPGQKYGRWEARVKSPKGASAYNSLLLLWPDAENFPVGGEVDFMEISDQSRQKTELFLHYGADNSQENGSVAIDATQWHNWAVEWTPDHIAAFVDGKEWYRTSNTSHLPPGPMHLCIQLDYFPDGHSAAGGAQEMVAWAKQYPLGASGSGSSGTGSSGSGSTGSGSTGSGSTGSGSTDTGSTDTGSTDTGSTGRGSTGAGLANGATSGAGIGASSGGDAASSSDSPGTGG